MGTVKHHPRINKHSMSMSYVSGLALFKWLDQAKHDSRLSGVSGLPKTRMMAQRVVNTNRQRRLSCGRRSGRLETEITSTAKAATGAA